MRTQSRLSYFLTVTASLAILAGCSSGTVQSVAEGQQSVARVIGGHNQLDVLNVTNGVYTSMGNPGQTNLYALPNSKNVAPKCSIATGVAHGIGVDSIGTLWVTNPASSQITS